MERAGMAVALAAVRMGAVYGRRVMALAGPGNNGGDAYVASRHLRRRGVAVEVRALGFPRGDFSAARKAAVAAVAAGVPVHPLADPEPCDLVIDGLFGAGFLGSLDGPAANWVQHSAPVVAIDLPSGLRGADGGVDGVAFSAERTVTFHSLKVGHLVGEGPDRCGVVEVADIGLEGGQATMLLCEAADAPAPPRARTTHKWSAGSVIVVGGSPGLGGAAMLAARSALACGAGAARIACPGWLQDVYAALEPGVMTTAVGDGDHLDGGHLAQVLDAGERFDVMVVGPGLGLQSAGLVERLLVEWHQPLVIDADAIGAVSVGALAERQYPTIVTPHEEEFRGLTGDEPGHEAAAAAATNAGVVVLLKGNPTIVASDDVWIVTSGGPELATIGTGDVLAGMVGALWARGLDAPTAARSAAFRHGLAGRAVAERTTVTAPLLADEVGGWAW